MTVYIAGYHGGHSGLLRVVDKTTNCCTQQSVDVQGEQVH